jgi:nucleoid DNA-binding protein
MNKKELIKRVAEKLNGLPNKTAVRAVDAVFESIAEGLQEDGVVTIGKWGTYKTEDIAGD